MKRDKRKMKQKVGVLTLCIVLAGVCISGRINGAALSAETPAPEFTVKFSCGGELVAEETVAEGEEIPVPELNISGYALTAWVDAEGSTLQPGATAMADGAWEAELHPILCGHEPYLFPNEDGFLEPDRTMCFEELTAALEALTSCGAEGYTLPKKAADAAVDWKLLSEVMAQFMPRTELPQKKGEVSRRSFAVWVDGETDRCEDAVEVQEREGFADVSPKDEDFAALMESACRHSEGKKTWEEAIAPQREEGPVLYGAKLYYIGSDGFFVKNDTVGVLSFDENGRYTSGSEELDALTYEILSGLIEENPELSREELLRASYVYVRDSFQYLRRRAYASGADGWQTEDAITILTTGKGNCYCYAAAFCALARNLGYEAYAVSGTVGINYDPHGWVVMFDGEAAFVYDTELEMALTRRGEWKDMYAMDAFARRYWAYCVPEGTLPQEMDIYIIPWTQMTPGVTEPTEPGDPTEPTEPGESGEPTEPSEPTEPTEPSGGEGGTGETPPPPSETGENSD